MARFYYVSRDSSGKKISGVEDAVSQEELISRLQARELFVVQVLPESSKEAESLLAAETSRKKTIKQHSRITLDDRVLFCRQFSTLLSAGVTVLECLRIISRQVSSRQLFKVIQKIVKDMEAGASLHEAMSRHPRVFSDLWVNLTESGEASGNLALIFERLSSYLERNAAFRRKVISALIYPSILMTVGVGALLFLTIKIIPTFASLFDNFNIKLPLLTRLLIKMSFLIRHYFLLVLGVSIVLGFLIRRYIRTPKGRRIYERFLFSLPLFGEFFKVLMIERFASGLSTLIESGVPIVYALEITEGSVANLTLAEIIRRIKEGVREGRSLSEPLNKSGFFEPMVVQMVAIGEEIGDLPGMFKKISAYYQEYVERFLARFTSMFEPIMLIFMGAVIGIMVVGMFLPIFQIARIGE
jgi:type IV pilus assembly protein PilC